MEEDADRLAEAQKPFITTTPPTHTPGLASRSQSAAAVKRDALLSLSSSPFVVCSELEGLRLHYEGVLAEEGAEKVKLRGQAGVLRQKHEDCRELLEKAKEEAKLARDKAVRLTQVRVCASSAMIKKTRERDPAKTQDSSPTTCLLVHRALFLRKFKNFLKNARLPRGKCICETVPSASANSVCIC